jgi:hypothetical protein
MIYPSQYIYIYKGILPFIDTKIPKGLFIFIFLRMVFETFHVDGAMFVNFF